MSHAVHINGFSPNGDMWAGLRAKDKATDPGKLDNLAAGGLSAGEDIYSTLHRELQEESGWKSSTHRLLHPAGDCRSQRVESESWHDEKIWVFNLDIPFDFSPINEDGEVEAFYLYSPHEVVERMEADQFSTDACLAICAGLGLPTRRPISR